MTIFTDGMVREGMNRRKSGSAKRVPRDAVEIV
jgi:hypothetical protein